MTVTLALTSEQERRLQQAAQGRGLDADTLLHQMLEGALAQLQPVAAPHPRRVAGLHTGQYRIGDDFDDPL